jgi:non-ribosomal peptide synthetase component E (peptide arylation enzyme)
VLISGYKQLEVGHLAKLTEATAWIAPSLFRKIDYTSFVEEVKASNPGLKQVISVRSEGDAPGFTASLESLMEPDVTVDERQELERRKPDATDVSHILPSGGTTGLPKGIPRTHNDYICNVEYVHRGWEMNPTDTELVVVPVGHNLALLNVVGSVLYGYKLILNDSTIPSDICSIIEREKVTFMPAVPSLVRRILELPELAQYDFSSLKKISAGGEPSTPELIRDVYKKLQCTYVVEFGMSEGILCRTRLTDDVETICNTVGKPTCPYDEVRVMDPDGRAVPEGCDGELATRGPCIFAGYLKNPEENRKAFTPDGFFRTGDQARIDGAGYLRITGRIKDIIIRGGENVSPVQVENLLCEHEDVAEAAVIGISDKDLGERVCACIRLAPGCAADEEAIKSFMEKRGASRLLIPERFVFVEAFPTTQAGKLDKKALRKKVEQGHPSL